MNKLWEALVLVREGKMTKNIRSDGNGAHCALGFLEMAHYGEAFSLQFPIMNDGSEFAKDREALGAVMSEIFPKRSRGMSFSDWAGYSVASVNNHPDTTKEDLELVFEKAAIRRDELVA